MCIQYRFGQSVYDFEEMIVWTGKGFYKLSFGQVSQQLFRLGNNKLVPLSPGITKKYLDYRIEKILLEDNIVEGK